MAWSATENLVGEAEKWLIQTLDSRGELTVREEGASEGKDVTGDPAEVASQLPPFNASRAV